MAYIGISDDLIEIIRKHLDLKSQVHVAQFRGVCQSWRSYIPSFNQLEPQPQHPLFPRFYVSTSTNRITYTIQRSLVYHIAPPPCHANHERERGWLVRLDTKNKLLPPLSCTNGGLEKPRLMMNSLDFGVLEVAKPYLIASSIDNYYMLAVSDFFPAVMFVKGETLYLGKWSGGVEQYVELSPVNPDDDDPSCSETSNAKKYDDVIFYNRKFCVVSQSGEAAAMDSSFKWEVIASPVRTSMWWKTEKKKNLVESLGELLLVERHGSAFVGKSCNENDMLNNEVKFKVYKLDGNRNQWVEMHGSDLDDRILFVGKDCCFSVSTKDFPGCQGNCVYFSYEVWRGKTNSRIGVFHLDVGRALPLEASVNIFLPPPIRHGNRIMIIHSYFEVNFQIINS